MVDPSGGDIQIVSHFILSKLSYLYMGIGFFVFFFFQFSKVGVGNKKHFQAKFSTYSQQCLESCPILPPKNNKVIIDYSQIRRRYSKTLTSFLQKPKIPFKFSEMFYLVKKSRHLQQNISGFFFINFFWLSWFENFPLKKTGVCTRALTSEDEEKLTLYVVGFTIGSSIDLLLRPKQGVLVEMLFHQSTQRPY